MVRTALENAASIAGLMLTTETLVTDLNKEDKKNPHRGERALGGSAAGEQPAHGRSPSGRGSG